jgi:phytoene dehydrogenase-like protein
MTSEKVSTFQGSGKGPKVAVLGGGVAGMSAAHELVERGFQVAVLERQTELCGGKARSIPVPVGGDSGTCSDVEGAAGCLPGEHEAPALFRRLSKIEGVQEYPGSLLGRLQRAR